MRGRPYKAALWSQWPKPRPQGAAARSDPRRAGGRAQGSRQGLRWARHPLQAPIAASACGRSAIHGSRRPVALDRPDHPDPAQLVLQPGWKRQRNRLARDRGTGSIVELIGKPGFPRAIGVPARPPAHKRPSLGSKTNRIGDLRPECGTWSSPKPNMDGMPGCAQRTGPENEPELVVNSGPKFASSRDSRCLHRSI
jgi:hypothetical protein